MHGTTCVRRRSVVSSIEDLVSVRCASLINELLVEKKNIGKKYPQIVIEEAGTFLPRKCARRAVAILTRSTTIANFIIQTNRNSIIFIRRQSTARTWGEKKNHYQKPQQI